MPAGRMPTLEVAPPAAIGSAVEDLVVEFLHRERDRWREADPWLAEPFDLLSDYVLTGGKRLRPCFCLYGLVGAGGDLEQPGALETAAALELLHAFALLHDDVMDGSDERRGRAAFHRRAASAHRDHEWRGESRRFGESLAVLVGDLGFASAERLMAEAPLPARLVWHDLTAELVMGQYLDVAGAARGGVDSGRAVRIARYKSGAYTVERPLQIGAALAGRLPEMASAYAAIGRPLGEAFQFRDDLLGVFGDRQLGKPVGQDLVEGKPTLLLAVARERCRGAAARLLVRVGRTDLGDGELEELRLLLEECGARGAVEAAIEHRYHEAMAALRRAAVADAARPVLEDLAAASLWRRA